MEVKIVKLSENDLRPAPPCKARRRSQYIEKEKIHRLIDWWKV